MTATAVRAPTRRATVVVTRAVPRGEWKTPAAYATLFGLAAALGRLVQEDRISLLWPAAGVLVLWGLARGRARRRWVDLVLVVVVGTAVFLLTGSPPLETAALVTAQVVQAVGSVLLLDRSATLRAGRGQRALRHVEDLWLLVAAALVASTGAALASQLLLVAGDASLPWSAVPTRAVRNAASVLVIVPAGLALVEWAQTPPRPYPARPSRLRTGRIIEHTVALCLVPLTYASWFWLQEVPLVFPLLVLTVWAGARLRTWFVLVHDTVAATAAIAFTVGGAGPFVGAADRTVELVLAQLYIGIVCTIGLALALARDERIRLAREASRARDAARAQAELLSTVVDTMTEGVSVVDVHGRIILRNPRATELLGVDRSHAGSVGSAGEHGLLRLDGDALPDDELPYRQALAAGAVRELLLRRAAPDARGETRILAFNSSTLPRAGSGVVTVVRDVTAERRELEHAAQVQARLSPEDAPVVPGYEVAARVLSAGMVGGDFYDWGVVDGRLTVVLADVMGKGLGAAILAATARTALRARPHDVALGAAVAAAERTMADDLARTGAFVTALVAQVDPVSHRLDYVDAGHGLSFVARAATGQVDRLAATGPPLGILAGDVRESRSTVMQPGDLLVSVSDGMLDALGGAIADLGAVDEVLRAGGSAADVVASLIALVRTDREVVDDVTVVALRRLDPATG